MAETNSKKIIAWGHIYAATSLMNSAWEMISKAFWKSYSCGDPIGVSDRLRKLMNDAEELGIEMQLDTEQLFRNSLDDEQPTTAE
ncbi:hypothetical protein [Aeriscardovia aeriphila]|uniref:Uncharacterized protein n=1 Tax=Aeriscardovia aeriphila TaxID=218139 RepID=A0A261FA69_9BIFI|nr:hypothetical protein [Aeriscardovia aeriphila]NYI25801.1 hypothetical protein [Aeriscardovia aeriphila]OZG56049.1 hypothetical protein AEAE_0537 [Aeriscardovia aeriphila]